MIGGKGGKKPPRKPLTPGPCESATWTTDDESWVPDEQRLVGFRDEEERDR